jgi:exodeoxyribonuclease VII small subunit
MSQTYEQAITRVEAIVLALRNDTKPLSDAISLFDEAMQCLRDATTQLSAVESKVKILVEEAGVVAERDM